MRQRTAEGKTPQRSKPLMFPERGSGCTGCMGKGREALTPFCCDEMRMTQPASVQCTTQWHLVLSSCRADSTSLSFRNIFFTPEDPMLISCGPSPQPLATVNLFSLWTYLLWIFYVISIRFATFCICVFKMCHVVAPTSLSFLFTAKVLCC